MVRRDKLPSLPTLATLVFAFAAAWKELYVLAAVCVAGVFVMTYFDAQQEKAYRRVRGAGVRTRGWQVGDFFFDVTLGGLILLATLIMLGVI